MLIYSLTALLLICFAIIFRLWSQIHELRETIETLIEDKALYKETLHRITKHHNINPEPYWLEVIREG